MRGTHRGQQSSRTAPTGRTHDCKRHLHHAPHDLLQSRGHPHMNRRGFILLVATAAIDRNPAAAEAKMPRIGFIQAGFRQDNLGLLDSFGQALAALGWTDSSTIAVLYRWAEEQTERLPTIVKELIGSGVRVLVTAGTRATLAARRASTTMPIVMVGVGDPVSMRAFISQI